jgi:hypothetical protein
MITYNNEDASNSYIYSLYNKDVDFIDLRLTDELNEEIKDAPDFLLSLQFIIQERKMDLIAETTLKLVMVLNDIKIIILQALKYMGFFSSIQK